MTRNNQKNQEHVPDGEFSREIQPGQYRKNGDGSSRRPSSYRIR